MLRNGLSFGLLLILFSIWLTSASPPRHELRDECYCSAMNSTNPKDILVEHPLSLKMECNEESQLKCKQLCVSLVKASEEDPEGGNRFCKKYHKDGYLDIHVFTKLCKFPYEKSGVIARNKVCCKTDKAVPCKEFTG